MQVLACENCRKMRRYLAVLATILVCGILFGMPVVSQATRTPPAGPAVAAQPPRAAAQPDLPTRDPFAVPGEFQAAAAAGAPSADKADISSLRTEGPANLAPVLTGLIACGGSRSAIIKLGPLSRSYQEGDVVGAYRVVAVGASAVPLDGPHGTQPLGMRR